MSDSTDTDDDDPAWERMEIELERAQEFIETAQRCLRAGVHMDPDQGLDALRSHFERCIAAAEAAI